MHLIGLASKLELIRFAPPAEATASRFLQHYLRTNSYLAEGNVGTMLARSEEETLLYLVRYDWTDETSQVRFHTSTVHQTFLEELDQIGSQLLNSWSHLTQLLNYPLTPAPN